MRVTFRSVVQLQCGSVAKIIFERCHMSGSSRTRAMYLYTAAPARARSLSDPGARLAWPVRVPPTAMNMQRARAREI